MFSMSFRLRLSISLAALCAVSTVAADELPSDLGAYIESGMKEWNLPGLAIAVVKDGKPILLKGYGVREAGKPEPVDENTLFAIGSASKAFTATALGILVDREKIAWNTKIHDIDPNLKLSEPWITNEIRISDLPSNHSGLSAISESLWYGSGFSREEIMQRLQNVPFNEGFRYQFQYRNVMFLLAGEMIPKITKGQTWDEFVTQDIFAPLGMKRSWPTEEGAEKDENLARPHLLNYEGKTLPVPYRAMHNIGPAGSIMSCVSDLVPWVKVNLGQNEVALIESQTLRFLQTAQTPMWSFNADGGLQNSPFTLHSYCLGWVSESYQGYRIVWHNGNIDGMSAWVGMVPEIGLGVAMLTNLDDCEFRKAVFYRLVNHFIGKPDEDLNPRLLESYQAAIAQRNENEDRWQKLAKSAVKSALPIEDYAGEYTHPVMGKVTLRSLNDRLIYRRTRQQTLELVVDAEAGNHFLGRHTSSNEDLRTGKVAIEIEVVDGKVTGMIDRSETSPIIFKRNE